MRKTRSALAIIFSFFVVFFSFALGGCEGNTKANKYTVTWKNYDGTVLEVDRDVNEGDWPTFDSAFPTKEGNGQYTYTFDGWSPKIAEVTGDITYTAQFKETISTYTITWNVEGTLTTESYQYGEFPSYKGSTPTKKGNEQFAYTFKGWSPKITQVTEDKTYTALFSKGINTYTITWNVEGIKTTESYQYGKIPSYKGSTPTKKSTAKYAYSFYSWYPNIAKVTGDETYYAVFEPINLYTITWDIEGTKTAEVYKYGETPSYKGSIPTKKSTAKYTYAFKDWSPEITKVTGDKTYTALFETRTNTFTITFDAGDGFFGHDESVHKKEIQVEYGEIPVFNEIPWGVFSREYSIVTFSKWDSKLTPVYEDKTYTAVYDYTDRRDAILCITYEFKKYNPTCGFVLQGSSNRGSISINWGDGNCEDVTYNLTSGEKSYKSISHTYNQFCSGTYYIYVSQKTINQYLPLEYLFYESDNISRIDILNSHYKYKYEDNHEEISVDYNRYTFSIKNCSDLKEVYICDDYTSTSYNCMNILNNSNLTNISFKSYNLLKNNQEFHYFSNNPKLKSVSFGTSTVTRVGYRMFYNITS